MSASKEAKAVGHGPLGRAADEPVDPRRVTRRLARLVLFVFILTFVMARLLVIAIMAGKLPPGLFFHVAGTHVHHLNYGIFLLSASGAYLIFVRPSGRRLSGAAAVYGIGLALTFDEFGMWLHLGGLYWQRVSYDAIIVIAAILTLIAYGTTVRNWRAKHNVAVVTLVVALGVFGAGLYWSMQWAGNKVAPMLDRLEEGGPK